MRTVRVRFVGPDPVDIDLSALDSNHDALRQVVNPGDVITVPHEIAHGREGTPVIEDGEPVLNPDTGEPELEGHYGGLLDQSDKWVLAKAPKTDEAPVATEKEG